MPTSGSPAAPTSIRSSPPPRTTPERGCRRLAWCCFGAASLPAERSDYLLIHTVARSWNRKWLGLNGQPWTSLATGMMRTAQNSGIV